MKSAFICDKKLFRHIYELEKRRSGRDWASSYFYQIKVASDTESETNSKKVDNQLMNILKTKIRSGDVICHLEVNDFAIILYDINFKNSKKVIDRISNYYFNNGSRVETDLEINCKCL